METGEQAAGAETENRNRMANQNNPRPTGDDDENEVNEVNHRVPGSGGKRDSERDDEFAAHVERLAGP